MYVEEAIENIKRLEHDLRKPARGKPGKSPKKVKRRGKKRNSRAVVSDDAQVET